MTALPLAQAPVAATPPGPITARSVGAGLVFSLVLCVMNSYLTLSFGVIEEGPTIAALFFFALFMLSKAKITTTEMVVVATMGSAGGSLGFIANFYAAKAMLGAPYTVWQMAWFGAVSSMIGMIMVVPLRQVLILREDLPWPGSKAVQSVITALVEHGDPRQARILIGTLVASMAYVIFNEDGPLPWLPSGVGLGPLAAVGGAIALSPFAIGGSYLMGFRVCVGFLVGAIVLMIMAPYTGTPAAPNRFYWPGLGFLVSSGLMALALNWRLMRDGFRSMLAIGKDATDDDPMISRKNLLIFSLVSVMAASAALNLLFGVPFFLILVLIVVGGLVQNFIATRAAAQTAFNPARVMGILLQGVTASLGGRAADINLTGAGFVAGSGAQAGNLTGDLVYGRWLKVKSSWQFWLQAVTIIPCSIAAAWAFHLILATKPDILEGGAPIGKMWAASARVFEGLEPLPAGAMSSMLIGAVVGILYTLIESRERLARLLPHSIGVGLGMVLAPALGLAFFIGGFLAWIVGARWLKMSDVTLTTIAVACIVAEGIGGVVQAILMAALQ
jgi:uncharacterized oligopeptide transporter (OPT) family protein